MTSPVSDTGPPGSATRPTDRPPRLRRRPGWRRTVFYLLGLGVAVFLAGFAHFVFTLDGAEHQPERHADAIVALTGGPDRVADAVALLAQGHADRLLITGVNTATTRDDLARHTPGARAWIMCCVDLGYRAADTIGNAQETADWVRANGFRSLIVVTSNYHMPRALAEMGFELPGVDLQPYAVVRDSARPLSIGRFVRLTRLLVVEYVKLQAVRLRQAIDAWSGTADDNGKAPERRP